MAIQVTDLHMLRDQLVARRQKLETAVAKSKTANLLHLLEQVDNALERADQLVRIPMAEGVDSLNVAVAAALAFARFAPGALLR